MGKIAWDRVNKERPTLPLWIRDVRPGPGAWVKMANGYRHDGLPDGFHTGGCWLHLHTREVWKPLDGRPYPNCDCHVVTDEAICLAALVGRPGFPRNWRLGMTFHERSGMTIQRRWLVRPKCYVLGGKDWTKDMVMLDDALHIESIIRGMNQAGWKLNDAISIALDNETGHPFILDLSSACYRRSRDGCCAPNDRDRILKWFKWLGFDRLATLREKGQSLIIRNALVNPEWPGREWRHVYASRNRPVSLIWASRLRESKAHLVHDDWGTTGVHTWVVTPEPLGDDIVYTYELMWAWSPLVYDEKPALPVYWWL